MPLNSFFATTPKAMESILCGELTQLGAQNIKTAPAGVYFEGELATAYRACLWSRIANRVLLLLSTFEVKTQDDLYYGIKRINWFEHMRPEDSFAVSFNAKNSEVITHSQFGALKVKDAIVDQMRAKFNKRPSVVIDRPDIRVNVHLHGRSAQLSLDLSGESLHRRGYRDITIEAPIKENLAAAMLLKSDWPDIAKDGGTLIDPMCGSGTLLIEAAMIAGDFAPGLLRDYFGFLGWKKHDAECWRAIREEARQHKLTGLNKMPVIVGFDRDRQSVNAAQRHIANAGLLGKIHVERRDIADAIPAAAWQPGLVICNPPYGERLGDSQETADLYRRFGEILKARFLGWKAALIISDPELGFRLGIRSQKPVTLFNGALECKLLRLVIEPEAFFTPKAKTPEERISRALEKSQQNLDDMTGAEMFGNRLAKNLKKLGRWIKQNRISCYRLYDADLPEYAIAVDIYQGDETWINVQEYEPPKSVDPFKAERRLAGALAEISRVLGVSRENVFLKIRRKQKKTEQYEKQGEAGKFHKVEEGGCAFWVNFENYLDTGLFLDHRPMRLRIQNQAMNKRFLNLFAYTGTATVHAAKGGACSTTTVDMSQTYLNWAKRNMLLNAFEGAQHEFIQANCLKWLAQEVSHPYRRQYDLIFLDPPTFSNSKRMEDIFDIQQDHVQLIVHAAALLAPNGELYFSTNSRRFKLDHGALSDFRIEDISAATIPEDFSRNLKIHYCWRIQKACAE